MVRKRVVFVSLILLIGAGLWGWIAFNSGIDFTLPTIKPAKAEAAAASDRFAEVGAANLKRQRDSWGGILVKGCEAGMSDFEVGRFDTDGDNVADKVCWRPIQTAKDGDFVGVAVIAKNPDGTVRRRGYAVLPAAKLPSGADDVKIARKAWTDKDLSDHQWAGDALASPVSVAVSRPGEAAWLFWPKAAGGEAVPLVAETQPR